MKNWGFLNVTTFFKQGALECVTNGFKTLLRFRFFLETLMVLSTAASAAYLQAPLSQNHTWMDIIQGTTLLSLNALLMATIPFVLTSSETLTTWELKMWEDLNPDKNITPNTLRHTFEEMRKHPEHLSEKTSLLFSLANLVRLSMGELSWQKSLFLEATLQMAHSPSGLCPLWQNFS